MTEPPVYWPFDPAGRRWPGKSARVAEQAQMTEPPVIPVHCEGSPGEPHVRFIAAAYRRAHATPTPTPALWTPERWFGGVQLRPVERWVEHPDGSLWLRFHHWCDLCRFDAEYNAEPFIGALFAVLP